MERKSRKRLAVGLLAGSVFFMQVADTALAAKGSTEIGLEGQWEKSKGAEGNICEMETWESEEAIDSLQEQGGKGAEGTESPENLIENCAAQIPDEALYKAMLEAGDGILDGARDGRLAQQEAAQLESLTIEHVKELTNLSVYAPNLHSLFITGLGEKDAALGTQEMQEISALSHLAVLCIQDKKIPDLSPLAALSKLQKLKLNGNGLKDVSVLNTGHFPNLLELDLGRNPLEVLPDGISTLTGLDRLVLSNCGLKSLVSLKHIPNLQELNLNGNKLTKEEIITHVSEKFSEDELWLGQSFDASVKISYGYSQEQSQDVIRNDEAGIPDAALYAKLLYLGDQEKGDKNGILTPAEAQSITRLSGVEQVLDFTNLAQYAPNIIYIANLNYNHRDKQADTPWTKETRTSFFQEYEKLENLRELWNINFCTSDFLEALNQKTSLTKIYLNLQNGAVDISPLGAQGNLAYVKINNLTKSVNLADTLNHLTALKHLELNGTGMEMNRLDDSVKGNLDYLNLAFSGWGQEDGNAAVDVTGFDRLNELYLSGTLGSVTGLGGLNALKYLSISNYGKELIPCEGLEAIQAKLERLTLSGCRIQKLRDINMEALLSLKYLYLQKNQISDASGIEELTKLRELNLSFNQLREIPDMTGLERLLEEFHNDSIYYNLRLEGNKLSADKIIGYVPNAFSDHKQWLAQASAFGDLSGNLYYSILDSELMAGMMDFSENGKNRSYNFGVTAAGTAECSQQLLGYIKEYNNTVNICFYDTEKEKKAADYQIASSDLPKQPKTPVCLKAPEVYGELEEISSLYAMYGDIPITCYGMGADKLLPGIRYHYYLGQDEAEQFYNICCYEKKTGKITTAAVNVQLDDKNGITNYIPHFVDDKLEYFYDAGMEKTVPEGFYYVLPAKYTRPNNTPGEYSEPEAYLGIYYTDSKESKQVWAEMAEQAEAGSTIKIAVANGLSITRDTWNKIQKKKLNLNIILLRGSGASGILADIRIAADQIKPLSDNEDIFINGFSVQMTPKEQALKNCIGEHRAMMVSTKILPYCITGMEGKFYAGNCYTNGESLSIFRYRYYRKFTEDDVLESVTLIMKEAGTAGIVENGMVPFQWDMEDGKSYNTFFSNGPAKIGEWDAMNQEEPEEPEEPENPGSPEEPENPGSPEEPENPENPGSPEEPENPENPGSPEEPENPENPENPGSPEEPGNPENPGSPEEPENPGSPEEPENPGSPEEPENPENPGTPGGTENPDIPSDSGGAGQHSAPQIVEEDNIIKAQEAERTLRDTLEHTWKPESETTVDGPVTLTKELFESMKKNNKKMTVGVVNEKNELQYSWSFDSKSVDSSKIADIDLSIRFETEKQKEIEALTGQKEAFYISFAYHGDLPGPAEIKTYVGNQYKNGEVVFLYYFNEETGKIESVNGARGLVVEAGYVTYTITHCSVYFLSAEQLRVETPSVTKNPEKVQSTSKAPKTGDAFPPKAILLLLMEALSAMLAGIFFIHRKKL